MKTHDHEHDCSDMLHYRFKIALVIGVALLSLYVLQPFISALIWSGILALVFVPLQRRLEKQFSPYFSASINIMLMLMIVIMPLIYLMMKSIDEIPDVINIYNNSISHGIHLPESLKRFPRIHDYLQHWIDIHPLDQQADKIKGLSGHVIAFTHRFGEITEAIFIALMSTFFLLTYHETLEKQYKNAGRFFLGEYGEEITQKTVSSVRGTVSGLVFVGLGEGVLSFPVLLLTHTPHSAIVAFCLGIFAMIPLCATIFLTLICGYMMVTVGMTPAIIDGLVIFIILFAGDHFVRPVLIGGSNKMPFMIVILGILGGLHAFGILGLFVGPAIFTIAITLWKEIAIHKTID